MLATLQPRVLRYQARFKVGRAAPVAVKRGVVERLGERAESGEGRAADAIDSYLPSS